MTELNNNIRRLGLGTVQFGLDYGISNTEGQTPVLEAERIIKMAAEAGVRVIDTASGYGDSEEVLGRILPTSHSFQIVTKTEQISTERITPQDAIRLTDTFQRSLENLRCDRVYGLLIHHVDNLAVDGGELLFEALVDLKSQGLVEKIGVSVYTGSQIDFLLKRFPIELVQLPLNVFDQRLLADGHLDRLKRAGVKIHARSAFLQGLLLMEPCDLPPRFNSIRGHLRTYQQFNRECGLSSVQSSLSFVLGCAEVDCVVVGVCSREHLHEIIRAANSPGCESGNYRRFAWQDEDIIDPTNWKADLYEAGTN